MRHVTTIALFLVTLLVAPRVGAVTQVILLGTGGGPGFYSTRAQPGHAVWVNGEVYLVDCGNGIGEQMRMAALSKQRAHHVFVTHHHSDHMADLVSLPVLMWPHIEASGVPFTWHGPKPLKKAVKAGLMQFEFGLNIREVDEGKERFKRLVQIHQFKGDGVVHEDELVRVTAARVDHVPIREAYAYRFDTADLSVVFSGDTAPSEALVRLAQGADILVHEVLLWSLEETSAELGLPIDHPLVQHVFNSHTHYSDVGRIANDAGVGTLVLTHFVPAEGPLDEAAVLTEIQKSFAGEVVFGEDLMWIPGF